MDIHTHTHTYILVHTHTYILIHTHAYSYTHIHAYSYIHTYIHIFVHTHTYTHTYIHIYTPFPLIAPLGYLRGILTSHVRSWILGFYPPCTHTPLTGLPPVFTISTWLTQAQNLGVILESSFLDKTPAVCLQILSAVPTLYTLTCYVSPLLLHCSQVPSSPVFRTDCNLQEPMQNGNTALLS